MKKIFAILSAFALALIGMVSLATPSSAAWSEIQCKGESGLFWNIGVCAKWDFKVQADGTGVKSKGVDIEFTNGCPGDTDANPTDNLSVNITGYGAGPDSLSNLVDCAAYRTWTVAGPDTGSAHATLVIPVNVNNANDYELLYECTLRPNLTSDCTMTRIS